MGHTVRRGTHGPNQAVITQLKKQRLENGPSPEAPRRWAGNRPGRPSKKARTPRRAGVCRARRLELTCAETHAPVPVPGAAVCSVRDMCDPHRVLQKALWLPPRPLPRSLALGKRRRATGTLQKPRAGPRRGPEPPAGRASRPRRTLSPRPPPPSAPGLGTGQLHRPALLSHRHEQIGASLVTRRG